MAGQIPSGYTEERLTMIRNELTKVRCWLSGFGAARLVANVLNSHVPGEDSLRQVIVMIDDILKEQKKKGKQKEPRE
jgi:hypothetical protein